MSVQKRDVFFLRNGNVGGPLLMDVLIDHEVGEEGKQPEKIYGYATQINAGQYVDNRYPIEWDAKEERFVVYIPSRTKVN